MKQDSKNNYKTFFSRETKQGTYSFTQQHCNKPLTSAQH